ncbi:MAG: hypothetical protein WBE72_12620 [Terracidiphilus sp.]
MRIIGKMGGLLVSMFAVFVFGPLAKAQAAPAGFGVGQTIKLSVKVEGADASQIFQVRIIAHLKTNFKEGQRDFLNAIDVSSAKQIGPNTFEVDYPVLDNQADGDYLLDSIQVTADHNANIVFGYSAGDFDPLTLHVRNTKTIQKPHVSVSVLP